MTERKLVDTAMAQREKAYVPYSHFAVGAALECADGSVYTGCNVENAAYGECMCAERTAVFKAVSEGKRCFVRIAVAGSAAQLCAPCGACRQVLAEFSPDMEILCADSQGNYEKFLLSQLLPVGFSGKSMS